MLVRVQNYIGTCLPGSGARMCFMSKTYDVCKWCAHVLSHLELSVRPSAHLGWTGPVWTGFMFFFAFGWLSVSFSHHVLSCPSVQWTGPDCNFAISAPKGPDRICITKCHGEPQLRAALSQSRVALESRSSARGSL